MGKIITLASGKGGVGKTVVTASLGAALAQEGKQVLLLDGDMGLRDLDLVLGLEDQVLFDVFDVATGRCFESDAILHVRTGLDFLPASQRYRWEEVAGDAVLTVLEDLRDTYDYILIDSPAGIGKGLFYTLRMADDIILVAEPTWVSLRDTDRVMGYLNEERLFHYSLLFNNFHRANQRHYISFTQMYTCLQPENLAGVLPYAKEVLALSQEGNLAHVERLGSFGKAMAAVAEQIIIREEKPFQWWETHLEKWARETLEKPEWQRRRERSRLWRRSGRW